VRIALAGALLLIAAALPPLTNAETPSGEKPFDEQTVAFASFDADLTGGAPTMISAVLIAPKGAGPFPAIVLAHGCDGYYRPNGKTPSATYHWWGQKFAEEGYLVLLPDSFRPRGRSQVCVNEPDKPTITPGRERARDVQAARAYLAGLPIVKADRIGLMGWSNGGSTVLSAISMGAPAKPETGNFRAAVAFYPGCFFQMKDSTWAPAAPTLILIGLSDDWTPAPLCQSLVDRLAGNPIPITMHSYPDTHHAFDAPNLPLRVRTGVNTKSGTATIGTNPASREDAILRTLAYFQAALK
jgi:dienelactone hydrolase